MNSDFEIFLQSKASVQFLKETNFIFAGAEDLFKKAVNPIVGTILILGIPMLFPITNYINIESVSPSVVKSKIPWIEVKCKGAPYRATNSAAAAEDPTYDPAFWNVVGTTSGDSVIVHSECTTVERWIHNIQMPAPNELEERIKKISLSPMLAGDQVLSFNRATYNPSSGAVYNVFQSKK